MAPGFDEGWGMGMVGWGLWGVGFPGTFRLRLFGDSFVFEIRAGKSSEMFLFKLGGTCTIYIWTKIQLVGLGRLVVWDSKGAQRSNNPELTHSS